MKVDLQECLIRLVNDVFSIATAGLQKKTLSPEPYRCVRWKVTDFEYSDAGITRLSQQDEKFLKPMWHYAVLEVQNEVKKSRVYKEVLKKISESYDLRKRQIDRFLEKLVSIIAFDILEKEVEDPSQLDAYVVRFLKDLNKENQESRATVGLLGIIMRPEVLELDENTTLKKTAPSDLEREAMVEEAYMQLPPTPTAIMYIKVLARGPNKLQREIHKAIAVLKLFKVGSVRYTQYRMSSESITDITSGTITSGRGPGPEKYLITDHEVESLKTFWSRLRNIVLPDSVYRSPERVDHISIAYQRYTDALDVGVLEKRMASAIMGLEALYLHPGERQELSYRLRLRAAKLLSLSGYDSREVYSNLADAYDIRSTYVHGGVLNQKQKTKLKKRHENLVRFLRQILDYLRTSIVVFIVSRQDKKPLIDLIDGTFVDPAKNRELRGIVASASVTQ